jgi:hypothetical protein
MDNSRWRKITKNIIMTTTRWLNNYYTKTTQKTQKKNQSKKAKELVLQNLKHFDYVKRFHYHKDNFKRWLVLLINGTIKMRLRKLGIENLGEAEQYVQYI